VHHHVTFSENVYEDVYRKHIKTLTDLRASKPNVTSKLLRAIYAAATCV
jgi:hypothetical protein